MADGRERAEWQRWSYWCALFAECNRDTSKRRSPFTPADFDPFTKRESKRSTDKISVRHLGEAFAKGGMATETISAAAVKVAEPQKVARDPSPAADQPTIVREDVDGGSQ